MGAIIALLLALFTTIVSANNAINKPKVLPPASAKPIPSPALLPAAIAFSIAVRRKAKGEG